MIYTAFGIPVRLKRLSKFRTRRNRTVERWAIWVDADGNEYIRHESELKADNGAKEIDDAFTKAFEERDNKKKRP